jgi:prepilin-type N-terminal cleavage/methylation domain-containing protein
MSSHQTRRRNKSRQQGFTLVEVLLAAFILVTVSAGIMSLFTYTFGVNRWQGELNTKSIEYAQDKMESLMALTFNDSTTDTTQYPPCGASSSPACTTGTGLTSGGGTDTTNPIAGYSDCLDSTGNLVACSSPHEFTRVWKIAVAGTGEYASLKQITVVAQAIQKNNSPSSASTTLVCYKSSQATWGF